MPRIDKTQFRSGLIGIGLLWASFSNAAAQTPSFSCDHAATPIEHAVCSDSSLATADAKMADAYNADLAVPEVERNVLKEEQMAWLKQRDKRCQPAVSEHPETDKIFLACVKNAYEHRITQLLAGSETKSACVAVEATLETAGHIDANGPPLADIAANESGSDLRLDGRATDEFTLKSTYSGSLQCQSPHLFQKSAGGSSEITLPQSFAREEGALCGSDKVRLASINGIPGLLREFMRFDRQTQSDTIGISLRKGKNWVEECRLFISMKPEYQVAIATCAGGDCGRLKDLAEEYTNANHGVNNGQVLPPIKALSADDQTKYSKMIELASTIDLAHSDEVPYFGSPLNKEEQKLRNGCSISFDGVGGTLFPVLLGEDIMLGKIGHDGFGLGMRSGGPDDAIAIYRLIDGALQPVGGFCVVMRGQTITSIESSP